MKYAPAGSGRPVGAADLDALTRGSDLVGRHGRDILAVTVQLGRLGGDEARWLERARAMLARERGMDVEIWFGAERTAVRFARQRGA